MKFDAIVPKGHNLRRREKCRQLTTQLNVLTIVNRINAEHHIRNEKVRGSNPLGSTKILGG